MAVSGLTDTPDAVGVPPEAAISLLRASESVSVALGRNFCFIHVLMLNSCHPSLRKKR